MGEAVIQGGKIKSFTIFLTPESLANIEINRLQREIGRKYHFDNIIGRSTSIKWVYHFPAQITQGESMIQRVLSERGKYHELLSQCQRRIIENALKECSGNRYQAAKMLGMDRSNMVKLIKRLGVDK